MDKIDKIDKIKELSKARDVARRAAMDADKVYWEARKAHRKELERLGIV
tara:strand:- start:1066 stop:1212 length:147 start_codon:yes stop_codon:yes gene_type:complete